MPCCLGSIRLDWQDKQIHLVTQLYKVPRLLHRSTCTMSDYSAAIYGLIAFASVITAGVVYVLAQPSDLSSIKKVRS